MRRCLSLLAGGSTALALNHRHLEDGSYNAILGVNAQLRDKSIDDDPDRKLQFFDFYENTFVLAGIPLLPEESHESCSNEWIDHVTCTVLKCPGLVYDCPKSMFFDPTLEPDLEGAK